MKKKDAEIFMKALSHLGVFAAGTSAEQMSFDYYKEYQKFRKENPDVDRIMKGYAYGTLDYDAEIKKLTTRK